MLEIHIIGTTNSGKSIIAKLIAKTLAIFNIPTFIIDEMNLPVNYEKESLDFDAKRIIAVQQNYNLGRALPIRVIQMQKEKSDANTKLSDKE